MVSSTTGAPDVRHSRLRPILAALAIASLTLFGVAAPSSAQTQPQSGNEESVESESGLIEFALGDKPGATGLTDDQGGPVPASGSSRSARAIEFPGQVEPGYNLSGVLGMGDIWLGALENPNGADWLAWCIQAGLVAPTVADSVTVATLTGVQSNGQPADLTVTTPQMAWILANKEKIATADSRAAIGYLVHLNYEIGNGSLTGPMRVAQMIPAMNAQYPGVVTLAKQYVAQAKASAAVGYENTVVEGENTRNGLIKNIGVRNAQGQLVAGINTKITLNGPAVFTETGTNVWTGKTATSALSLEWESTGNGEVTYSLM